MCERLGIPCKAYIPGEGAFPSEYLFLPGLGENVLRGAPPSVEPETTVYFFDCASLLRSNSHRFPENAIRINIDHHGDNPGYGELNLVDPNAPSTTAILYKIFKSGYFPVDPEIAMALYVGLVTDTGRFQYSNTTAEAHRMAAELQEAGVDVAWIYRQVYESTPLPKLMLLERALRHLEIRLDGALAVSWLAGDDFAQSGADEGHAEGIIDILRRIHGVRLAALVRERLSNGSGRTKVSLRSTDGSLNVAELAHKQGGGGHPRAAGFTSDENVEAVLNWIEAELRTLL
jgi:phosphoesterase RecJ-like protein